MIRIQKEIIKKDLEKKMVFLVGPRQAGKTWLAQDIAKDFPNSLYLNYDQVKDRSIIKEQAWLPDLDLLVLDELHKMPNWKIYLKGVFDTKPKEMRLLVTGSARLNIYDRVGDSLAGRYFKHRLLPLSLAELKQSHHPLDFNKLLKRGGFPEPYFSDTLTDSNRWRLQYTNSLLSTDIFEFETIHNLKGMRLLFDLLRQRVGSPISYKSLAEDIAVSPTTIKKYIQILEALYVVFVVTPYSKNIARSLLKEPKIYFFDTGLVDAEEAQLENLVAVSLLKHTYGFVDQKGEAWSLHYLRTKDGEEVDFALVHKGEVDQIIEVKTSESNPAKSLTKFHERYGYTAVQIVQNLRHEHKMKDILILNAEKFLSNLYL